LFIFVFAWKDKDSKKHLSMQRQKQQKASFRACSGFVFDAHNESIFCLGETPKGERSSATKPVSATKHKRKSGHLGAKDKT
jgi:hypothetical protein